MELPLRNSQPDAVWYDARETYFLDDQPPFRVKFRIEKLTGVLLCRNGASSEKLVYEGGSTVGITRHELTLRFEAVLPKVPYILAPPSDPAAYRNLFSLRAETSGPREWLTQDQILRSSERAFNHWTLQLACCSSEIDWRSASRQFYFDRMRESIELEAKSQPAEDPAAIRELQNLVVEALRAGKTYRSAHHEGGTILSFDGTYFVQEEYGEEPSLTKYATGEQMLAFLRRFFDWDACKESFPHRPPELEIWKYIVGQFSR
jgi:hypothetical protein